MRSSAIAGLLLCAAVARGADLPECALAPGDPPRLAVEPCRPAPPRLTPPRRPVPQSIARMPQQAAPPVSAPPAAPAPALPAAVPGRPLSVNSCDIGGCRDAAGVRHEGGVGNATLDPNGRLCNRNGVWLQCF